MLQQILVLSGDFGQKIKFGSFCRKIEQLTHQIALIKQAGCLNGKRIRRPGRRFFNKTVQLRIPEETTGCDHRTQNETFQRLAAAQGHVHLPERESGTGIYDSLFEG